MEASLGEIRCGMFDSRSMRGCTHRTPSRRAVCYELELFSEGTGVSHIGEVGYPVRPAMLLCAKPGQVRYSELPVRCRYIRIGARPDMPCEILDRMPDVTYLDDTDAYGEILAGMDRLMQLMCEEEHASEAVRFLQVRALLYEILYRCVAAVDGGGETREAIPHRAVREACAYLDENYLQRGTLQQLAAHVHVSPNYLHTLFHREMGMTPLAYVMEKRIARAKRWIMAGEMTLLEIALGTGFCSQSHFNRVFREHTGETPAAFRRRWMENY